MNRISRNRFGWIVAFAAFAILSVPSMALAHVGQGPVHDLSHGFESPFATVICLFAVVGAVIWAVRRRGGAIWKAPLRLLEVLFARSGK